MTRLSPEVLVVRTEVAKLRTQQKQTLLDSQHVELLQKLQSDLFDAQRKASEQSEKLMLSTARLDKTKTFIAIFSYAAGTATGFATGGVSGIAAVAIGAFNGGRLIADWCGYFDSNPGLRDHLGKAGMALSIISLAGVGLTGAREGVEAIFEAAGLGTTPLSIVAQGATSWKYSRIEGEKLDLRDKQTGIRGKLTACELDMTSLENALEQTLNRMSSGVSRIADTTGTMRRLDQTLARRL